jgi:hypothetical protein
MIMGVNPVRTGPMSDLECEIFDAMLMACRLTDRRVAQRLFGVWINMPAAQPWVPSAPEADD